ncbi:methyl-accepting chemotaxis protein [Ureibacillus sp. NPDC094379]
MRNNDSLTFFTVVAQADYYSTNISERWTEQQILKELERYNAIEDSVKSVAVEAGKGFAVVAYEVRTLVAEQSATATKQIAEIISKIRFETNEAVEMMATGTEAVDKGILVMNEAGQKFVSIQENVMEVTDEIKEVSNTTVNMSQQSLLVSDATQVVQSLTNHTLEGILNIFASTEEQLASMEEISASADELAIMADRLQQTIKRFRY